MDTKNSNGIRKKYGKLLIINYLNCLLRNRFRVASDANCLVSDWY